MVEDVTEPESPVAAPEPAKPRKVGKWKPELRYVRDRFNIPDCHSGPNRAERRRYATAGKQKGKKGRKNG